jgi:hypothetical protein
MKSKFVFASFTRPRLFLSACITSTATLLLVCFSERKQDPSSCVAHLVQDRHEPFLKLDVVSIWYNHVADAIQSLQAKSLSVQFESVGDLWMQGSAVFHKHNTLFCRGCVCVCVYFALHHYHKNTRNLGRYFTMKSIPEVLHRSSAERGTTCAHTGTYLDPM